MSDDKKKLIPIPRYRVAIWVFLSIIAYLSVIDLFKNHPFGFGDPKVEKITYPQYTSIEIAFSNDGKFAFVDYWDQIVRIINLSNMATVTKIPIEKNSVSSIKFSPNNTQLMLATTDNKVKLLSVSNGKTIAEISVGDEEIVGSDYLYAEDSIVTLGKSGDVKIWKYNDRKKHYEEGQLFRLNKKDFEPKIIHYAVNRNYEIAYITNYSNINAGSEGHITLWNLLTGRWYEYDVNVRLNGISFSPKGNIIALAADEGLVLLDRAKSSELVFVTKSFHSVIGYDAVEIVAFSPKTGILAADSGVYGKKGIEFYNAPSYRNKYNLPKSIIYGSKFIWSSDEKLIATSSFGTVFIYDAKDGQVLYNFDPVIRTVAGSEDGNWLAVGHENGTIHLFDLVEEKSSTIEQSRKIQCIKIDAQTKKLKMIDDRDQSESVNDFETPRVRI